MDRRGRGARAGEGGGGRAAGARETEHAPQGEHGGASMFDPPVVVSLSAFTPASRSI